MFIYRVAPVKREFPYAESMLLSPDEKRQKRLEKNRQIAKNCRKRKKEKREALEEEVGSRPFFCYLQISRLREENERMRIQLQDGTDESMRKQQKEKSLDRLRTCLEKHDMEGLQTEMREFVHDWMDYGQKRLTMAEFHLEQLKMLVLPTQVISVI